MLSGLILIALIGILAYFIIQILSSEKDTTLVPLNLSINLDQAINIKTHYNQTIETQVSSANTTLVISKAWPWFYFFAHIYFLTLYSITIYGLSQLWLIIKSMRKSNSINLAQINKYALHAKKFAYTFFGYASCELIFYLIFNSSIKNIQMNEHAVFLKFDYNIVTTFLWGFIILLFSIFFKHQYLFINKHSLNT